MTDAQCWTALGLVGVLLSVISGMIINQLHLLQAPLDARFDTVDARFEAVDRPFDAVDRRFDNLERAVFRWEYPAISGHHRH